MQSTQPIQSHRLFRSLRWLFLVALLAIACDPLTSFAATKVITDSDKGGVVNLKVGDTLELRLRSNPDTGFLWYVRKESTPLLKLAHQSVTGPVEQSPKNIQQQGIGRPVLQIFNFELRRAGDGVLRLHYVRSWEAPVLDEEQFEIHLVIE